MLRIFEIVAIFAGPNMKKLLYMIFMAVAFAAIYHAEMIPAAELSACMENVSSQDNRPSDSCNIIKDDGFRGFFAYNALNGTSEQINASDNRQVLVYRNTYGGPAGYNPASSKRQHSPGLKWLLEGGITHSFPEKYYFLQHNVNILDRGMSSNSERIHLLRILIV